ncbi:uncharacterized protein F54H12.2 [Trichonephila clavata]|uniref:Uncharacterized protein F54H12.2 n=1 Tax=Trichonephila clavata TaxID=2740835 RepID=A0A8X6FNW3_TRICU|nr:uncharacterized protein F54H12.2 [Trichonephila clavata]
MHLDRRACQDYYCSQLQNGGSYFQGVSHQRGYGMFSNLFRMISPIAMKAGKYLGKHILSTGFKDGNRMIPSKPYQPKFDTSNSYSRCYMSLFTDLGRYHKDQDINISYSEYKDGYTLLAIDLTPDLSADGMHDSVLRNSNLALDIRFSKALPETVNLIVYAEYRNVIEIDKNRNVLTDF